MKTNQIRTSYFNLILFSGNETATTASFNLIAVFFMLMMTDNLLLSGIIAGIIFAFSRVMDAFTDPIIGTLIDRTTTKFGKYRPFIILGSFIINIGLLAIFGGFVRFSSNFLMYVWIIFWYMIYIIGYTFQSACTRSAQTVLSNDPIQRPFLGALLSSFSYLFYGIFLITSIKYVQSFEGGFSNPLGYRYVTFIVIGVNMILTLFAVIGLRKNDREECYKEHSQKTKVSWNSMMGLIKHNTPLKALIVAAGTNKLAQLITATSMVYFFTYTVHDINMQPIVATYGLIFGIIGVIIGMVVAQIFGRKRSFMLGTYLGLFFPIIIVVFHPFTLNLQWLLIGSLVAIVFSTAIASSNVLPLIADVADYENYVNKQYIPSIVGTTFSLVDKLMSSLSGVILAIVLWYIDYVPGMEPSNKAFWAFYLMVIIIPALGHVASILAFKYFPITKEYHAKMIENSESEA